MSRRPQPPSWERTNPAFGVFSRDHMHPSVPNGLAYYIPRSNCCIELPIIHWCGPCGVESAYLDRIGSGFDPGRGADLSAAPSNGESVTHRQGTTNHFSLALCRLGRAATVAAEPSTFRVGDIWEQSRVLDPYSHRTHVIAVIPILLMQVLPQKAIRLPSAKPRFIIQQARASPMLSPRKS